MGLRISALPFAPLRCDRCSSGNLRLSCFAVLSAVLYLVAPQAALGQGADPAPDPATQGEAVNPAAMSPTAKATFTRPLPMPVKRTVESEITVSGLVSYGHYKIFASGENCKLYEVSVEYDRHSWGRFLGARMDYVAEVMPIVLLNQPTLTDIWGNTLSQSRKTVPGVDISPIGFRWLWRDRKSLKPYLSADGGIIAFTQKAISSQATYENFSLRSSGGVQIRMNDHYDLRLGLFGDLHFSDGFIVPVNPGLDVMNATFGVTRHLGNTRRAKAY